MTMADPMPEQDDLLAAELAFGLLDGDDRDLAEARVTDDAAFADSFHRWQSYAVAMLGGANEAPRPSVWSRIEARLPANDGAPRSPAPRSSVRLWRAGTLVASAAAVVLAVMVAQRGPIAPPPPPAVIAAPQPTAPMVAMLSSSEGKGFLAVSYDPASGRLTSAPTGMAIGAHSAELWVIPADGKPRSLGVVADKAPAWTRASTAGAAYMGPGVTLAISVEPIGGSPTGLPTGKVIMTGKITPT